MTDATGPHPGEVAAVVLETNGKLSVITSDTYGDGSALQDVNGAEDLPRH